MIEPVAYRYGPDPAQFGELSLPDRPALGTVVIIHGGFWRARYNLSLGRPLAADLAARGYAAWNLEYRRAGGGGGWPSTFEDVAAGIDLLATLPADTARVVAVGHSAGGHLGVWAAGRSGLPDGAPGARPRVPVTGVVSQAGVLTLADCAREGVGGTAALDLMGGEPGRAAGTVPAGRPDRGGAGPCRRALPAFPRRYERALLLQRALCRGLGSGGRPGAPGGDVRRSLHADRPGQRRLGNRGRRAAGAAASRMRVAPCSLGENQSPFV